MPRGEFVVQFLFLLQIGSAAVKFYFCIVVVIFMQSWNANLQGLIWIGTASLLRLLYAIAYELWYSLNWLMTLSLITRTTTTSSSSLVMPSSSSCDSVTGTNF